MKNTRILRIAVVIALLFEVVTILRPRAVYRFFHPANRHEVMERLFKDQEIFDVMTNSPQVTAQRMRDKPDCDSEFLSGYTLSAPVKLTVDQAQQIKSLLQNPSSYLWDVRRTCLPHYGVVYNFQSGGRTVRAAFCFKCNSIGIFGGDNDTSNAISAGFLFDPIRGQTVTLSKTLFPDDQELRALK